jgi:hypothetical protein
LPSTAKICSPEKESFALQLKAMSDKLVNQVCCRNLSRSHGKAV